MKTIIYTAFNEAYRDLASITVPRIQDYAFAHDFDWAVVEPKDKPDGVYWAGVDYAIQFLRSEFDRTIWLDVDQLVTNLDAPLPDATTGIHFSKDWGNDAVEPWHFSACGWVAHRDSIPLLEEVAAMESEFYGKPFPEQAPLREAVRRRIEGMPLRAIDPDDAPIAAAITIHPRRTFNAVPEEVCPGKIPESWQPGDWCAHLTMLPIRERIELARKILAKL